MLTSASSATGSITTESEPWAEFFAPLPTDLRSPKVQSQSEGALFQHLSYGIGGSGRQPALATTIFIDDRWKIVAFVKSLGTR